MSAVRGRRHQASLDGDRKQLGARIPQALIRRTKLMSIETGRTMVDLLETALHRYLDILEQRGARRHE